MFSTEFFTLFCAPCPMGCAEINKLINLELPCDLCIVLMRPLSDLGPSVKH